MELDFGCLFSPSFAAVWRTAAGQQQQAEQPAHQRSRPESAPPAGIGRREAAGAAGQRAGHAGAPLTQQLIIDVNLRPNKIIPILFTFH